MARIAGIDLPRDKRVEIGLTYIFGIGLSRSKEILAATGVNPDIRIKDLSEADVTAIRGAVEGYQVEGDLRRLESNEYQAFNRHWFISRSSPSYGAACTRTTHPHKCQNTPRQKADSSWKEKSSQREVIISLTRTRRFLAYFLQDLYGATNNKETWC